MPYLIKNDYKTYIQGDYLRQLVQADDNKRVIEENTSLQVIVQKLTQKYDLNSEFTDMQPYNKAKTYAAGERVTVDFGINGFTAWVTLGGYSVGDLVINAAVGYICSTGNNDVTFNPAHWTSVGAQYTIYYGAYPSTCTLNGQPNPASLTQPYAPVFNYKSLYSLGDVVYWKGNTYVAKQPSTVLTHFAAIQYQIYTNLPFNNVFPDNPVANKNGVYWNNATAYVITPNTPLTNSAWVRGDNRNQTIKDAMVRITVFKLSPLIAPMNRPEVWLDDYRSILRELNDAANGLITLVLPSNQPQNNLKTAFGGDIKLENSF